MCKLYETQNDIRILIESTILHHHMHARTHIEIHDHNILRYTNMLVLAMLIRNN